MIPSTMATDRTGRAIEGQPRREGQRCVKVRPGPPRFQRYGPSIASVQDSPGEGAVAVEPPEARSNGTPFGVLSRPAKGATSSYPFWQGGVIEPPAGEPISPPQRQTGYTENRGSMVRRTIVVISVAAAVAAGGVAFAQSPGPTGGHAIPAGPTKAGPLVDGPTTASSITSGTASGVASSPPICPKLGDSPSQSPVGSATHLFTRTTGDGVTVRAYRLAVQAALTCGPVPDTANTAPTELACQSTSISLEMSDDSAVGNGFLGLPVVPFAGGSPLPGTGGAQTGSEPKEATSGAFGVVEGDPVWWVALQVGGEVATAQVTFTDGSSDEMAPVGGVAVLLHHVAESGTGSSDPYSVQGTVTLSDGSGNVIGNVTLPQVPTVVPMPLPDPSPPSGALPGADSVSGSSGTASVGSATTGGVSPGGVAVAPLPGAVIACPLIPAPAAPLSK